jgi:hypothetical protein
MDDTAPESGSEEETSIEKVVDEDIEPIPKSVLEQLPEEILQQLPKDAQIVLSSVSIEETRHSGPLPSPDTLQKYEEVLSGLADRIMTMTETEQTHPRFEGDF